MPQTGEGPETASKPLTPELGPEPLWLPKGSVRAILVLSMTGFTYYAIATNLLLPDFWEYLWGGALALYGVSRTVLKPDGS